MSFESSWSSEELSKNLCDVLVAKGHLKEKPAFIRTDRQAKLTEIFEKIGLDGEKMASFDNTGPLEMLIRKGTNGEVWVNHVQDALIHMLPEDARKATKKMEMDSSTKSELAAAKEKSAQRRERLEEERAKGGGRGGEPDRMERREPRPDRGGDIECFNCGQMGHTVRDCPEPRKDKGKGGGKGAYRQRERDMECFNCGAKGHRSRDCPEEQRQLHKDRDLSKFQQNKGNDDYDGGD